MFCKESSGDVWRTSKFLPGLVPTSRDSCSDQQNNACNIQILRAKPTLSISGVVSRGTFELKLSQTLSPTEGTTKQLLSNTRSVVPLPRNYSQMSSQHTTSLCLGILQRVSSTVHQISRLPTLLGPTISRRHLDRGTAKRHHNCLRRHSSVIAPALTTAYVSMIQRLEPRSFTHLMKIRGNICDISGTCSCGSCRYTSPLTSQHCNVSFEAVTVCRWPVIFEIWISGFHDGQDLPCVAK